MTFAIKGLLAAALLGTAAPTLGAQWNVARFQAGDDRLYAMAGADPALIATLGYARVVPFFDRELQLGIEGGVVGGTTDAGDFRARLGAQARLLRWRDLNVTANLAFVTRGTKNQVYRAINLGADLSSTVGVHRRGWFAAGEVGFDKAIVTRLTHTDWYRENVYPEAKNGWYVATGGTWRFGVVSGVAVGRTELVLRAGIPRTERGRSLAIPYYASLGFGVGL